MTETKAETKKLSTEVINALMARVDSEAVIMANYNKKSRLSSREFQTSVKNTKTREFANELIAAGENNVKAKDPVRSETAEVGGLELGACAKRYRAGIAAHLSRLDADSNLGAWVTDYVKLAK